MLEFNIYCHPLHFEADIFFLFHCLCCAGAVHGHASWHLFRWGDLYQLDYLHVSSVATLGSSVSNYVSSAYNAKLWHIHLGYLSSQKFKLLTRSVALGHVSVSQSPSYASSKITKFTAVISN